MDFRTRRWWRTGRLVVVGAVVAVAGVVVGGLVLLDGDAGAVAADEVTGGVGVSDVSAADLHKVARTRVYFGHQSVGNNILDGVPAVFAAHGVQAPPIEQRRAGPDAVGGFVAHSPIGENTKPIGKIQDFAAVLRGGMGRHVDVAVMKLCYVDITPDTDVDALFAAYRDTISALEKDFPDVTFVKATVPLTTQPGRVGRLKLWLKSDDGYGSAANATRERLNELIRTEYRGGNLFDVAAVESTGPDGSRVSGRHDGRPYFALVDEYAADPGHLNASGAQRAAAAWLAAVAKASAR
ncbi:hypothetical protein [Virgisporangium aurantiacum]|uniref:Uncharacterized protein n=1 Tax=Virgisporangium aurantiacum TaxID=175570 RepID=A0A8J3Z4J4_9ACTN|nr:hypothetical protein [Virgisporangium aurantiacum]GIJ57179.1 hypothetical protein Vau01_046950 [Virgisporangium aurantiacum]